MVTRRNRAHSRRHGPEPDYNPPMNFLRFSRAIVTASLMPLAMAQGLWAKSRTPRLPEAPGAREGHVGEGRSRYLVALGDSIIAGVGVETMAQALPARLSEALASELDCRICWTGHGTNGARTSDLLELPAGKQDDEEEPATSAARELEEETAFRPLSLEHVSSYYTSPGFCDELLHFYYSDRLEATGGTPEEDEDLEVEYYTLEEALGMVSSGEIVDGKTIMALLWLQNRNNSSKP